MTKLHNAQCYFEVEEQDCTVFFFSQIESEKRGFLLELHPSSFWGMSLSALHAHQLRLCQTEWQVCVDSNIAIDS